MEDARELAANSRLLSQAIPICRERSERRGLGVIRPPGTALDGHGVATRSTILDWRRPVPTRARLPIAPGPYGPFLSLVMTSYQLVAGILAASSAYSRAMNAVRITFP